MRTTIHFLCIILLAGCSGLIKKDAPHEPPRLQIGTTSLIDAENQKGLPQSYEGQAAEFGTIIWVYPDMKLYFKQGILEKIEKTGHNKVQEDTR